MGLISCGTCGERVAFSAHACPHCGQASPGRDLVATWAMVLVFAVIVYVLVVGAVFHFWGIRLPFWNWEKLSASEIVGLRLADKADAYVEPRNPLPLLRRSRTFPARPRSLLRG